MSRGRLVLTVSILIVVAAFSLFWVSHLRRNELNHRIDVAASGGDFATVAQLLERGANPNGAQYNSGGQIWPDPQQPPIFHAVSKGNPDAVRILLAKGANIQEDALDAMLLEVAVGRQDLEMFELLLKLGADPNARVRVSFDFNSLHRIVESSWRDDLPEELAAKFAELAIENGADVNDPGMHGFTPLIYAVSWEKEQLTKIFLEAGADVSLTDNKGWNAMDTASFRANKNLVSMLKKHGAKYGIQEAAALGDLPMIEQLLAEDPTSLEKRCLDGNSVLGHSLLNGHCKVGRKLIELGAAVDHLNDQGESLLHLAARGNCADLVDLLIDRGLDVNGRDNTKETPLHETTFSDCDAAAKVLIKRGADISAKQSSQITPLFWSAAYGSPKVLNLLIEAGADPDQTGSYDGSLPLGTACHSRRADEIPESVKILLASGAEVNRKDAGGRTAIRWAVARHGGLQLVSYLLLHGADPSIRDDTGRNALDMAIENEDSAMQLLLQKHMNDAKDRSDE